MGRVPLVFLIAMVVLLPVGVFLGPVRLFAGLFASGEPLETHEIFRALAPSETELSPMKVGESRATPDHIGGEWTVPIDINLAPDMNPVRLMIESTYEASRIPRAGIGFTVYLASDSHTLVGREVDLGGIRKTSPRKRSQDLEQGRRFVEGEVDAVEFSVVFDVPEAGPYTLWVEQPGRDRAEPLAAPKVTSVRAVLRKNVARIRTGVVGTGFAMIVVALLLGGFLAFRFGRARIRRSRILINT